MPTYVYRCEHCGAVLERRQRFQDPPLTECESCTGGVLRRVLQPVSVIFRGSGFYSTDHRGGATEQPGEAKTGAAKDGEDHAPTPAESTATSKTSSDGDSKSSPDSSSSGVTAPAKTD